MSAKLTAAAAPQFKAANTDGGGEMIERMANAIAVAALGSGNRACPRTRKLARAALEAMREPSDAMVAAGEASQSGVVRGYRGDDIPISELVDADNVWRGMVGAALGG